MADPHFSARLEFQPPFFGFWAPFQVGFKGSQKEHGHLGSKSLLGRKDPPAWYLWLAASRPCSSCSRGFGSSSVPPLPPSDLKLAAVRVLRAYEPLGFSFFLTTI